MNKNRFVGTWKLLSFTSRTEDGRIDYPLGKDVIGYITYTSESIMSVSIMSPNRPLFYSGTRKSGTTEEKSTAFDGYVSYCGRFDVLDEKVVHHIELSLFPNWVGTDKERFFEFRRNKLTLSTPPFLLEGEKHTAHLVWQRIE